MKSPKILQYSVTSLATIGFLASVRPSAAQNHAVVWKAHYYVQTGSSSISDDPSQGMNYGNGRPGLATPPNGAFGFTASFSAAGSVALPGGSPQALVFNSGDNQFEYPTAPAFSTQAALDAAFPNGTYTLALNGKSVAASLAGNTYPNAPLVTVSQGTWSSSGTLVFDPTKAITLTLNFTTNYIANQTNLELQINGFSGQTTPYQNDQNSGSSSISVSQISMTIPANTLANNGALYSISSSLLVSPSPTDTTSVSGYIVGAFYSANGSMLIQAGQGTPPTITSQPQSQTVNAGGQAHFSVQVSGTQPFTAQWYLNGVAIAGATQLGYDITYLTTAQGGVYTVTVSGPGGSVTSNSATLTVSGSPIVIIPTPYIFTSLAGSQTSQGRADGTGTTAQFYNPAGLTVDSAGNAYVADTYNNSIRKVTPGGVVSTLATLPVPPGTQLAIIGNGPYPAFGGPTAVAVDGSGNVFAADNPFGNGTIFRISPAGSVTTLASNLGNIGGLAVDRAGNVFVTTSFTILEIVPFVETRLLAGHSVSNSVPGINTNIDGTGSVAVFGNPSGIAVDGNGIIYVADTSNRTIRKITPTTVNGIVTTVVVTTFAGTPGVSGNVDGTGSAAKFLAPAGIAVEADGSNIYVADNGGGMRKITAAGSVTTMAVPITPIVVNETGSAAYFNNSGALALFRSGSVYALDYNSGSETRIIVGQLAAPPIITTQPNILVAANIGSSATLSVATSSPGVTFQWLQNGVNIAGATNATLVLKNVQMTNAGIYTVVLTNSIGSTTSSAAQLTVLGGPGAPVLTAQPAAQTIASGSTVVFTVLANGTVSASSQDGKAGQLPRAASPTTYQWQFNGNAISGATNSRLVISNATAANVGIYTCIVTNAGASTISNAATLAITPTANPGRLINLSVNTTAGKNQVLTVGFVIGGAGTSGSESLLIRATGPALVPFGVTGIVADPTLTVFSGQTAVASNDNWGTPTSNQTAVTIADSATGAFPLTNSASLDAALVLSLLSGQGYSVQVSGNTVASGTALAEIYDNTPASSYTLAAPRLINVSALNQVAAGEFLTAGFVVGGSTSKTVLIRATGPALAAFGVPGTWPDPQIALHTSVNGQDTVLMSNAGWGGDSQLTTVSTAVGAFAISNATSKDSVVLMTLSPGSYTAVASSVSGVAGSVLIEVYEVP